MESAGGAWLQISINNVRVQLSNSVRTFATGSPLVLRRHTREIAAGVTPFVARLDGAT